MDMLGVSQDYDADAIGFTAYKKQEVSARSYVDDLMVMAYPTLIALPDNVGAKKSVEKVMAKNAPKAQNHLERLKAANKLPLKK